MLATAAATLLLAAPAGAAPSAKDARAAADHAKRAVQRSVTAARSGHTDLAIARIAKAERLQARATRLSTRVAATKPPTAGARLLKGTAAGVDDGFDSYAELLPDVPPELQPFVLAALERLEGLRAELVTQLTGLVESLPPEAREGILAAIAAFTADGDLEALIAALSDPAISAAIQSQLQTFITELTATLGEQIAGLEGLAELLPPGAMEQFEAAMAQFQSQFEEALGILSGILAGGEPGLPQLPAELCGELEALLAALGIPVPPGLCPA